jgi:two-component system, response regulator PdtaR
LDTYWSSSRCTCLEPNVSAAPHQTGAHNPRAKPLENIVILVVEDEVLIRLATAALLDDAGYTVLEAGHADAAIRILESRSDIRAVFTDIRMPGSLDGLMLARVIQERWPPIHLLVASGLVPTEEEFPVKACFLRKPYAPKQVLKAFGDLFSLSPEPYRYRHNVIQNYGRVP